MATYGIYADTSREDPLFAADHFYAEHMQTAVPDGVDLMVYYFDYAGHEHQAWRVAAIQGLARTMTPVRVNAIVGSDPNEASVVQALDFLERSPGTTGQILTV